MTANWELFTKDPRDWEIPNQGVTKVGTPRMKAIGRFFAGSLRTSYAMANMRPVSSESLTHTSQD